MLFHFCAVLSLSTRPSHNMQGFDSKTVVPWMQTENGKELERGYATYSVHVYTV